MHSLQFQFGIVYIMWEDKSHLSVLTKGKKSKTNKKKNFMCDRYVTQDFTCGDGITGV